MERKTFESHGLRVSRGKTAYMPCPEKVHQTIYIQENDVKPVKTFKYLGSLFDANLGAEKGVNNRVKIAWPKWRETTGVICDRNIPTKLKDKVYKTLSNRPWCMVQNVGQLERKWRGICTQLKCACCFWQEERRD